MQPRRARGSSLDKSRLIAAGFAAFNATGLHRVAARWTRGAGAILMFHHVRPWVETGFAPNRLLEITPEFLDLTIRRVRAHGFEIVALDEAVAALSRPGRTPVAALTFDDGYIDLERHALPVLERHGAPFTAFVATGFADRTARLWWLELEAAIRHASVLDRELTGLPTDLQTGSDREKASAFKLLYAHLRAQPEEEMRRRIAGLLRRAGQDGTTFAARLCLDWAGVARLARHPLCTIGAHTVTHPMLAKHPRAIAAAEIGDSRRDLEARLQRSVRHFAYPVGDATSAGARDFALAAEAGFASAVTTRPGMIFPAHARAPTALPRLSVNGCWQRQDVLDVLLSGAAFAAWNRGRRWDLAA